MTTAPKPPAGVWAPVPTPLDADLAPAAGPLADHVRAVLDAGCHGVVLFGTTGEGPSFGVAERLATLEALRAAGIDPGRIVLGAGSCALPETAELVRRAAQAGCAATLVLPPFYFKEVSDEGLFRFFATVIERATTAPSAPCAPRLLLYHFPRLSGIPIAPSLLARLARSFPGIVVGLKDSTGRFDSLKAFAAAASASGLAIFPGTEVLLLAGLRLGAVGTICAGANLWPEAVRAVYEAHASGRWEEAERLQDDLTARRLELERAAAPGPLLAQIKRELARRTARPEWNRLRPPLV